MHIEDVELGMVTGGFWRSGSTYDPKSGHYISTKDYMERYSVDDVCQTSSCYDSKSGHYVSGEEWNRRRRNE